MPYVRRVRARQVWVQVDHTLECQLLAHVMTQTEELRPILTQLNSAERSERLQLQSYAVQSFLKPIYELHNGGEEHDYFNLRLVAQGPNLVKGHVVSTFIKQCDERERCGSVAANPPRFDLRAKFVEQFTTKGEGKFEAGASLDERWEFLLRLDSISTHSTKSFVPSSAWWVIALSSPTAHCCRHQYAVHYAELVVKSMKENLEQYHDRLLEGGSVAPGLQSAIKARGKQTRRQQALADRLHTLWGDACLWDT
jgi:hypothetical protein